MADTVLENMKHYTQKLLDAYAAWDLDAILADRAVECIYHARPETAGMPPMNNAEYRQWYTTEIMPLMKQGIKFEVHNAVYDAEAHKSVLHGISTSESVVGPYRNECILITSFNEAGDKAVKIEEMFDSAYFQQFSQRLQEFMSSREK
ncbi:hypothetical protein A1O7_08547 [Cladophialophora yegresii CBS 114405]|uniref:SnoaL-like domain-containing protein n=1 Tax=Cladophialophora yegresii CBS 114405 TaxID=1182544 RepID=W9VJE3_9EURO|nr:uncharacterized protein A1O7_08547 [Cladophialophora yegresii CBS 114405]EXJ55618.1 hypothetical protein A1O7_08547 [Cladophialophora yegresii CBS 114405]